MPTVDSVLAQLQSCGSEKTRATYARHGMPADRVYGVSVAVLKSIAKTIKRQQQLALDLYATGIMDAMYLAGMVADGAKMAPKELQAWAEGAAGMPMIAEYTVPWVTVENPEAPELALSWTRSKSEQVASAGWCTWSGLVATQLDEALNLDEIQMLLERTVHEMPQASNRVRYTMNGFVIAVGSYVQPLSSKALAAAAQLGKVRVDVGDTACKVPLATESIAKAESMGRIGQKRKTIRC